MCRDVEVNDSPGGQFNNEEEINLVKEKIDDWQEITRPDVFHMIVEKN